MTTLLRYTGLLVALQAVFSGIVFLLSDVGWLAILISMGFLVLLWLAGRSYAAEGGRWSGAMAAGLLAQLPGLQGTLRSFSDMIGWTSYDGVTDLQDFAMETWHTVLMPLLSTMPTGQVGGYYARYYIALLAASPLLVLLFSLAASPLRVNLPLGEKGIWK